MPSKDIQLEICGDNQEVAVIRLTRGKKRNALNDALIISIRNIFENLPDTVRAAMIATRSWPAPTRFEAR